jgi:DNA-binding LacI/PurR family transcriptional regulator/AraC-like DNA-binding protein/signal transduction histidine kinase
MASVKKRIGLVLASIHTGASLDVWPCFAGTARVENTSLFIFPGGRLNARPDSENLRNSVYSLVNAENLDGFVSWSSTIRYTESKEEFEHFHSKFDPLPFVTLTYKIPGHPCVEFDAYNGMKNLVIHCIRAHGARRIAFLRAPDFHQSALDRFKGYQDALREAGISTVPELVTGPFNWDSGAEAAAQLFGERSLVPGRDFDTLIGSSDLMVFGAVNYFAKQGYHVPRDYHAGGFNNSMESRILESPLSTVNVPYTELSSESFRLLLKSLSKKTAQNLKDVRLVSELIIRESCGCFNFGSPGGQERSFRPQAGTKAEDALARMATDYLGLNEADVEAMAYPVIRALYGGDTERFFRLFEKALILFYGSGQETETLLKFLGDIPLSGLVPPELFGRVESPLYRIIFQNREGFSAQSRYEKEKWNTVLNSLKCELLGTRDRTSLVQSLARHLPKIGINTAALALYGDEKISIFVGGFSPEGMSPLREERFPARLLVPASLKDQFGDGVFMIQPLFIENQALGYFVHNVPFCDGLIFEELRSAISYALKGIAMMEELVRAKRIAEQAERAKAEFLQTLENGLYDPLSGVMERLEGLERKIGSGREGKENTLEIIRELDLLKSFVASREAEAESLIDLTLSRIDELALHKTLFDPEELLPGIGTFPLLSGDTARLAQCFSLIREEYRAGYQAALAYNGLEMRFSSAGVESSPSAGSRPGLLLAERIILMHGGEFVRDESACTVTLPWITLGGQEPSRRSPGRQDHILSFSDPSLLPANFFDLPLIGDIEEAASSPGRTAFVVWNTRGVLTGDLVRVSAMRRRSEFASTPVLCYGKGLARGAFRPEECLFDVVERVLKSPERGPVLVVGPGEYWASAGVYGETIRIESMVVFNETVVELTPSLVIVNSVDTEAAAMIRQHPLTVTVPVIMIADRIGSASDVMSLSQFSRLLICHRAAALSPEFRERVKALIAGDEILPPHTGALVKKTLLYFDSHIESHVSRWKLAEAVNVSEDYFTRIFHRETGLSPWDYLNRFRVFSAAGLLLKTDETIQEIALRSGFQDHAYFCRVFKKIYGLSPGQYRKG